MPGWDADKPFVQSWVNKPRIYPPGFLIAAAPMAVVYHHTAISFYETTRLLILWFLLLAHVSLYFVFQSCLRIEAGLSVVWFLPLVIIYGEVIHWPAGIAALLTLLGACALALAWARAWVDLAVLAWLTLFFLTVREAYAWHILLALPWLAAPVLSAEPSWAGTARDARFAALLFIPVPIYDNALVPMWLKYLFS